MWWARDVNPISGLCHASSAIRCCFVNTSTNSDAFAVFPSNGVITWRPLLSTGSLGWFPCFVDTMGRSDSLPSASTRFEFFTSRFHCFARGVLPSVVGVPPGARELPPWRKSARKEHVLRAGVPRRVMLLHLRPSASSVDTIRILLGITDRFGTVTFTSSGQWKRPKFRLGRIVRSPKH
jgi:hypothetical protein